MVDMPACNAAAVWAQRTAQSRDTSVLSDEIIDAKLQKIMSRPEQITCPDVRRGGFVHDCFAVATAGRSMPWEMGWQNSAVPIARTVLIMKCRQT